MEAATGSTASSTVLLSIAVGLLGFAWLLKARLRSSKSSLHLIPGPPGLPLFGNWLSLLNSSNRHQTVQSWVCKYGKLIKLRLLSRDVLVITDPLIAQELLSEQVPYVTKDTAFCKSIAEMLPGTRSCLLNRPTCSDRWRVVRSCLAHSFSTSELHLDMAVARAKAWMLVEGLANLGQGVVVDMADCCTRWSLDVLGLAKFSYDFQAVDSSDEVLLLKLLRECSSEWQARRAVPARKWMWWANDSWIEGRQRYLMLQEFTREVWHDICSQVEFADTDLSLAAQLNRLRDPRTGQKLPDEAILPELAGLLLAGHEALGHSLAWALYLLAAHPDCQEACFRELQTTGWTQDPASITVQGLGGLVYLDGVVREALRLYPTWGDGLTRQVTGAGCTINQGQIKVPAGTLLWVHTYSLHRSKDLWGSAEQFDPMRWRHRQPVQGGTKSFDGCASCPDACPASTAALLSPRPTGGPEVVAGSQGAQRCPAEAFLPFGTGPRACLGQAFVQVSLKAALAVMLSCVKFELSSTDESMYKATCGLTLGPDAGIPLLISIRSPAFRHA